LHCGKLEMCKVVSISLINQTVICCRSWTPLPMPKGVIDGVHELADTDKDS